MVFISKHKYLSLSDLYFSTKHKKHHLFGGKEVLIPGASKINNLGYVPFFEDGTDVYRPQQSVGILKCVVNISIREDRSLTKVNVS